MANKQFRLIDLLDDMSSGKDVFFQSVRTVEDVMSEDVKVLTLDDTIETGIEFMRDNQVRHIPVVDSPTGEHAERYLIGIVSQRDVFRQISPYLGKSGEQDSDLKALRQPLTQILSRNPKAVSPDTSITDAITIMIENHIDMLPVLSGQGLMGIITSADILRLFVRLGAICRLCQEMEETKQEMRFIDLFSGDSDKVMFGLSSVLRTVKDIMTEQVIYVEEQESLATVMWAMRKGKFRHVPIVGAQKKLVGLISDRDILQHLPFHSQPFKKEAEAFRARLFDIAPNEPTAQQMVNHIMKQNATHVLPSCDFYTAVRMLYDKNISCLPVTDEKKQLLGIVTVTDVMRALLATYAFFEKTMV